MYNTRHLVITILSQSQCWHNAQVTLIFTIYFIIFDFLRIHDSKKNKTKRLAEEKQDYVATDYVFVKGSVTEFDYNMEEFRKEYDSVTLVEQDIPSPPNPANISVATPDDDVSLYNKLSAHISRPTTDTSSSVS